MWKATLKGFLAHKFRLALTTLAVILGVGFVAGTYVLTDTIDQTFDSLFDDVTRGVDVYVRAERSFEDMALTHGRVPADLLGAVVAVDGVAYAEGEVSGFAQMVDKEGRAISPPQAPTLGLSWPEHQGITALTLRSGRRPQRDGEVAIDIGTAEEFGFRLGDRIRVLFEGPTAEFTIVGFAGFGKADNLAGATLAAFDLRTAQRVLGAEDRFDAIDVVGEDGIRPTELRTRVAAVVPSGTDVITGDAVAAEQASSVEEGLSFFNTVLLVFAAVALFVGAFTIFNTFNILVTQRTRELGLLRALGASGGQVLRSVILEALLVGIVASAIGLGTGVLLAIALKALLAAFGLDLPESGVVLQPRTVVVSVVLGLVVTIAASIFPARRAARTAPIAALREGSGVRALPLGRRSFAGGTVATAGVVVLLWGLLGDGGIQLVGLGVILSFLGVAILAPVLARPLAWAIGAPMARLGIAGRLGRENAMRNPRRTASTSSALMIGLALVGTFLIVGASIRATIRQSFDETFKADFVLTSTSGAMGGLSPTIADHLRHMPDFATVSEIRSGQWREPGASGTRFLAAVDPATAGDVLELGIERASLSDLGRDAVLVQERTAEREDIDIGDTLEMELASSGVVPMEVVGTFSENIFVSDYVISLDTYEANFPQQLDERVLLKAAPSVTSGEARRGMDALAEVHPNVQVQDQREMREEQEALVDQLLGLITALLGLAVLIALLGIVNTLALSVLERTRELGLLRAVGMGRRQIRSMVRWESVIIALIGGVIGLAVGGFFGWALVTAMKDEGISSFAVPTSQLLLFLVVAGVLGVVAALAPARRAARLNVLRAIAHE